MLCISLGLNVDAFMAGCLCVSLVSSLLFLLFVLCLVCAVFVSVCVGFLLLSRHVVYCFNVVCLNVDGFGGLFQSGIVHRDGKAIYMDARRRLRHRATFDGKLLLRG
jgi:hypothetical protein